MIFSSDLFLIMDKIPELSLQFFISYLNFLIRGKLSLNQNYTKFRLQTYVIYLQIISYDSRGFYKFSWTYEKLHCK